MGGGYPVAQMAWRPGSKRRTRAVTAPGPCQRPSDVFLMLTASCLSGAKEVRRGTASPVSGRMTTITFLVHLAGGATSQAAWTAAPEDSPARKLSLAATGVPSRRHLGDPDDLVDEIGPKNATCAPP